MRTVVSDLLLGLVLGCIIAGIPVIAVSLLLELVTSVAGEASFAVSAAVDTLSMGIVLASLLVAVRSPRVISAANLTRPREVGILLGGAFGCAAGLLFWEGASTGSLFEEPWRSILLFQALGMGAAAALLSAVRPVRPALVVFAACVCIAAASSALLADGAERRYLESIADAAPLGSSR